MLDAGDVEAALPILEAAAEDSELAYGRKHSRTLNRRLTYIHAVGAASEPGKAAELAVRLAEDSSRTLGDAHQQP